MHTARGNKRSPIHSRQEELGAYFRDVSGWEGADWYGLDALIEDSSNAISSREDLQKEEHLSWNRER